MERAADGNSERQQSNPCLQPARPLPQGQHSTPHTRGRHTSCPSGCAPSRAGPAHSAGPPRSHTAVPAWCSQAPTDGAGGALSQAAETAFLKGCTGSGQLQARKMPGGCSPAVGSIWQVSLLVLTSQHGTSPHSRGNGSSASPPHRLVLWLEELQLSQPVLPHQPQLLLQPSSHPAFTITQKRGGNTTFPCTSLEHNMRLQQRALQEHPWRVGSLPQMTTANSKPPEMIVSHQDMVKGQKMQ